MVVDAQVFYWTPQGMRQQHAIEPYGTRYITVADAERLLEEAHKRGLEEGKRAQPGDLWTRS